MHSYVHCSIINNNQDMEAPKRPSTDKWIKKMWYVYTTEYCSTIKMNEIMSFAATCGEGNGNPLQYPCLENPMDGGAW